MVSSASEKTSSAAGDTAGDLLEMLHRFGQAILDVADKAVDEGDRAYFGSTNDLDRLRAVRDEYFEWRFLSPSALAEADEIMAEES